MLVTVWCSWWQILSPRSMKSTVVDKLKLELGSFKLPKKIFWIWSKDVVKSGSNKSDESYRDQDWSNISFSSEFMRSDNLCRSYIVTKCLTRHFGNISHSIFNRSIKTWFFFKKGSCWAYLDILSWPISELNLKIVLSPLKLRSNLYIVRTKSRIKHSSSRHSNLSNKE